MFRNSNKIDSRVKINYSSSEAFSEKFSDARINFEKNISQFKHAKNT